MSLTKICVVFLVPCFLQWNLFTQANEAELSQAAQESLRKTDATVAAGIVFKLNFQFGCHGVWNVANSGAVTEESPQLFAASMETLAKDLDAFSDSAYGKQLKEKGGKLIDFYTKAVVLTLDPKDRTQAQDFLKAEGISAKEGEPLIVVLVTEMNARLVRFAKLAEVPEWVYTTEADELGQKLEEK